MPRPINQSSTMKIPLSQIRELGNVRKDYDLEHIENLAKSILENDLINPITVKRMEETDEYGNPQYELICGHCRVRAFRKLCEEGNDFQNIPARIVTGNKVILQLIENVQRKNLSPEELEESLKAMIDSGMTVSKIADSLGKPLSWVSDSLAGAKIRDFATESKIETSGITTKALSQLRSVPQEKLAETIEQVKANGGTVKAAVEARKAVQKAVAPNPVIQRPLEDFESSVKNNNFEMETTLETSKQIDYEDFSIQFEKWTGIHLDFEESLEASETMLSHKAQIIAWLNTH